MNRSPEVAWKAALSQLRAEMSPATFTTWVTTTRFISFEDATFVIGVPDSYNRDWLESRLSSTLARSLTGWMGEVVRVQFIEQRPIASVQTDTVSDKPVFNPDRSEDDLEIQSVVQSLRSNITQPDKIVAVPKYLLRWLPVIGPDTFWLVIAFRQARFLNTIQTGRQKAFTVRAEEIYRWCGMSRASFWRHIQLPQLDWFIERLPQTGWGMNVETGRAKQNPNRYRIPVEIPLTPVDAGAIRAFLDSHNFQADPIGALTAALDTPLNELIPYPPPGLPDMREIPDFFPRTVEGLVHDLLESSSHPEFKTEREIQEHTTRLSEKILRPLENFQVSWYFLEEWLPKLGAGPAALVALLRSYGYYNPITGELRDEIWIEGGYEELAQVLGLARMKTLIEWLPSTVNPGKKVDTLRPKSKHEKTRLNVIRNDLAKFIQRTGYHPGKNGFAYKFKIKLDVEPLTDSDTHIHQIVQTILSDCRRENVFGWLNQWLGTPEFEQLLSSTDECTSSGIETLNLGQVPDLRLSNEESSSFETLKDILGSGIETLKLAQVPVLRLLKVLNGLRTFKPLLEDTTSTSACIQPPQQGVEWNLEELLQINRVSQKKRTALLVHETSGKPFVSWLLYGASSRGTAILDPVAIAISKLLQNPGEGAGGVFDRLAELTDEELRDLVWDELHMRRPGHADWREAIGNSPRERLRLLAEELGVQFE